MLSSVISTGFCNPVVSRSRKMNVENFGSPIIVLFTNLDGKIRTKRRENFLTPTNITHLFQNLKRGNFPPARIQCSRDHNTITRLHMYAHFQETHTVLRLYAETAECRGSVLTWSSFRSNAKHREESEQNSYVVSRTRREKTRRSLALTFK